MWGYDAPGFAISLSRTYSIHIIMAFKLSLDAQKVYRREGLLSYSVAQLPSQDLLSFMRLYPLVQEQSYPPMVLLHN